MSDPSIFKDGNPSGTPTDPAANPPVTDTAYATLLGMIVNESGEQKYKDVQEALKGAAHAQAYIAQLKAEKAELESKVNLAGTTAAKQDELERTILELTRKINTPSGDNPTVLDPEAIAALVSKTLDSRSAADKAKANQTEVASKLVELFGDDAEKKYNEAAQELGMTVAEMNVFASRSPKAVLKALGVGTQTAKQTPNAPLGSAVNTAGFQPTQDSFVGRNKEKVRVGATFTELQQETSKSKKMVEELHANGLSVHDLADPKVYSKYFK